MQAVTNLAGVFHLALALRLVARQMKLRDTGDVPPFRGARESRLETGMKMKLALGLVCCLGISGAIAAPLKFEQQELPPDRTSMEYGTQISDFSEKVLGHKWVSDKGVGFVFYEKENLKRKDPYAERWVKDAYFFKVDKYMYRTKIKEYDNGLFARQSARVGFIEFTDTADQNLQFRLIDNNTLEWVAYDNTATTQDQLILKRVEEFPEGPKTQGKRLESAEERGLIY